MHTSAHMVYSKSDIKMHSEDIESKIAGSLTVCVWASMELQILHVFAVQLYVEFLQGVVPLPQSWLQAQDPLNMFLHQTGL